MSIVYSTVKDTVGCCREGSELQTAGFTSAYVIFRVLHKNDRKAKNEQTTHKLGTNRSVVLGSFQFLSSSCATLLVEMRDNNIKGGARANRTP